MDTLIRQCFQWEYLTKSKLGQIRSTCSLALTRGLLCSHNLLSTLSKEIWLGKKNPNLNLCLFYLIYFATLSSKAVAGLKTNYFKQFFYLSTFWDLFSILCPFVMLQMIKNFLDLLQRVLPLSNLCLFRSLLTSYLLQQNRVGPTLARDQYTHRRTK